QPLTYTITDLGPALTVGAVGSQGTPIVGTQMVAQQQVAVRFSPYTPLGALPNGTFSKANGTNGTGIVGYASTGPFALYTHGFHWNATTGMVDLGTTGAVDLFSAATGMNRTGTIVGYADSPDRATIVPVV